MRSYLPTFGILVLTGACASSSTTAFNVDGGDGGTGGVDGKSPEASHIKLPGGDGGGTTSSSIVVTSSSSSSTAAPDGSTEGGMKDGGPMQTCVHPSDCTAPNLCAGNNGLTCLGGFCVPTNLPELCDNGVPCVTGTCDTTTNQCVFTPNNSLCPSGEYCDPVMNCVQMLPCTPGDGVCDRLDTTACAGLWSCSPTTMYCVRGSSPCPARPNATATCTDTPVDGGVQADGGLTVDGGSIFAECEWTCNAGYLDTNGDLNVPIGQPSMGCNCMVSNAVDIPSYPMFPDTNCDGINGTVADAVFVDTVTGNDSNPGTMESPRKTITAGIALAATEPSPMGFPSPHKDVYVSKGTYAEEINLVAGVSVYGGYDASNKWARATTNETIIQGSSNTGVLGQNLTLATNVQLLTISPPEANAGSGGSVYGVRIISSSGPILVQGCTITPGGGGSGANGTNGMAGARGGNAAGESGGASSCGAGGGAGGNAVSGATGGLAGTNGTTAGGGAPGGQGGGGGGAGSGCCSTGNGGNGNNGSAGTAGSAGADSSTTAAPIGNVASDGTYTGASGTSGASGQTGGGGGGGGSGGAASSGCPFNCGADTSGDGGGGGGGGCGGTGGTGGQGGGGSFGIVVVGSAVTINQCNVTAGAGGNGGNGATGAGGGAGGNPAGGDPGGTDSGSGGTGGNGGSGGTGGHGSGGTGGPSVCALYSPTSNVPNYTNNNCIRSGGGAAGASGGGVAPAGLPGLDAELEGL